MNETLQVCLLQATTKMLVYHTGMLKAVLLEVDTGRFSIACEK